MCSCKRAKSTYRTCLLKTIMKAVHEVNSGKLTLDGDGVTGLGMEDGQSEVLAAGRRRESAQA